MKPTNIHDETEKKITFTNLRVYESIVIGVNNILQKKKKNGE